METPGTVSIARVHFQFDGLQTFGAACFIAPDTLLTARHVVDPLEHSLQGGCGQPDCVKVETDTGFGVRYADKLVFPSDRDLDIALIKLNGPKSAARAPCAAFHATPNELFSVGDFVEIFGFVSAESDLQNDSVRVMGVHERAGSYICNKAVPEGYSGGPVMVDHLIVGVMYARNHGQGQSYFYGVNTALDFIRSECHDCLFEIALAHPLRSFPLGPSIPQSDAGRMLSALIWDCAKRYRRLHAENFINVANAARVECGPPVGIEGLIDFAELPNSDSPVDFWHSAFYLAGLKSPRMLAALLQSLNSEELSLEGRTQKERMLQYMQAK